WLVGSAVIGSGSIAADGGAGGNGSTFAGGGGGGGRIRYESASPFGGSLTTAGGARGTGGGNAVPGDPGTLDSIVDSYCSSGSYDSLCEINQTVTVGVGTSISGTGDLVVTGG